SNCRDERKRQPRQRSRGRLPRHRGEARNRVLELSCNMEHAMPEVYVHAVEGRTPAQKKALMKDITDAVVKNFGAPAEAVVVTIVESQKVNKAKAGVPFTER